MVVDCRIWRPTKKDIQPILMRGAGEEFSVRREMLRLAGVKRQQVRKQIHRLSLYGC